MIEATQLYTGIGKFGAFGAFGAVIVTLTSPRKHFTRQVESLSGPRMICGLNGLGGRDPGWP